ncbi:hypothetical protein A2X44_00520 [candidate division CPR3 bacterium GWF2_35_18]|uniref:NMT1/THI5 like protein domain protein n=1 Tax=candidate division CPR3 bacterium GW2011_GWF2_35_18 TaxID=1618350 RepID=A0A0G0BL89_UNCC3|nr:MAG: NMT1/THI5 like protein domain protein [candidate division CPR3 bacterium GW2011_GWF2_35_18]KKP86052.1 MAG: NMT1/THI5 like protein domain protein [candidate division CPR3 bacterium GW2011_GWE2_35_7]OGB63398.1 MAG: hypothetical protein A2X44_00520 [candidate division CPR3 bacterium GWF2_35_18]OGB64857.1 MAG: hypothetical protein A2250_05510 [candidate division CPR3 bacterium RIFOXYA2_FULL_35_13]OGB76742.1 MAG: hypothetical protein A2476_00365 [candidate division CPR3 bacterium RIFOXYC2_FU
MKVKLITSIFILLILTGLIIFLNQKFFQKTAEDQNSNLTKVKIGMGYIPNIQFTPFYVADENGYYEDEGLEVEFDYSMSTDLLKLLGQNELDFVIANGDEVVLAEDKDIPVKYIMTYYSKFPIAIVSLKDKEIVNPGDLKGKNIGLPGFYGSSYIGLQAFLQDQNINENEVTLSPVGYTQVQSLTENKVDAVVVFSMNEPIQLKKLGYEVNVIELSDYLNFASAGIVASDSVIKDKNDVAKAFVRATWKGIEKTWNDHQSAFAITSNELQLEDSVKDTQLLILQKCLEFWNSPKISEETFLETINTLESFKLIDNKKTLIDYTDNQFVESL